MTATRTGILTALSVASAAAFVGWFPWVATAAPTSAAPRHSFAEYQGIPISINEYGPGADDAPTIVITGGFPTDSSMFDYAFDDLAQNYHVVRYDHRGQGQSGHGTSTELNRLDNLAGEFGAVVDKTAAGHPVHAYGEGWGSYTAAEYAHLRPGAVASISSIGAPSLDLQHYALIDAGFSPANIANVITEVGYFAMMSTPAPLPEALAASGIDKALFDTVIGAAGEQPLNLSNEDMAASVSVYRANIPERLGYAPTYDYLDIPVVQVFQSPQDSPTMITGLDEHTPHLWVTPIVGTHANVGRTSWPTIRPEIDRAINATEARAGNSH